MVFRKRGQKLEDKYRENDNLVVRERDAATGDETHCPNSKLADKFFFPLPLPPRPSPLPIEFLLVERKGRSSGGKSRNDPQSRVKRSAKKGKGSGETLPMTFRLIDDARAASRFTFRIISSRRREGERREASFLNEIRSLRFLRSFVSMRD